ncbi:MAG: sugar phosphorylase [Acidobacteriota bacterium]
MTLVEGKADAWLDSRQPPTLAEEEKTSWEPYRLEPDYGSGGVRWRVPAGLEARILEHLKVLYGPDVAAETWTGVERLLKVHHAHKTPEIVAREEAFSGERFTERDVILITYGDLISNDSLPPLRTLANFAEVFFNDLISTIHILPFYPYSSDRGFAVTSYTEVDPNLGTWEDVNHLRRSFRLMFDGVFNHISSQSEWFRKFLACDEEYREYFTSFSSSEAIDNDHLELILRPRTSSLLSEFETLEGPRFVWTTFSRDQVDINFRNPKVLLRIVDILLFYVRQGADLIRRDAITYLWYELGTSCAHLEQTHACIQLMRDVLDAGAPETALITETNVPHVDNVSYFGDGSNEAQMVYNFALPSLVLHTFLSADATVLTRWAAGLEFPSESTTFFNFLDSHDGISLMGCRGILSEEEIEGLCSAARANNGFVSMKANGTGGESPFELNITWYSALCRPEDPDDEVRIDRFIASRAVALALRGVPGIYLPSLIGSENDLEGVFKEQGEKRDINRAELREVELMRYFCDPKSRSCRIYRRLLHLLEARRTLAAFHPASPQTLLDLGPRVFALRRESAEGGPLYALTSVSGEPIEVQLPAEPVGGVESLYDHVSGGVHRIPPGGLVALTLEPYQVLWLEVREEISPTETSPS